MSKLEKSLLPQSYPPLVKAYDVLEERLGLLPVHLITKNPDTIDARLLDYLAWEESVDVWDYEWPEDVKRLVIKQSAAVHRYKGTSYAVKQALAVFDVTSDLVEWFEDQGIQDGLERGTFQVTAYAGRSLYPDSENSINLKMVYAMKSVVEKAAPVSRGLKFRLGERFTGSMSLCSGRREKYITRETNQPNSRPHQTQTNQALRTAVRITAISDISHRFERGTLNA